MSKRHLIKRVARSWWIGWQETSATLLGMPIEVDADESGDRYVISPLITETRTTRTEMHGRI